MGKIISTFTKSKVVSDKVKTGNEGNLGLPKHGTAINKTNIPFKSGTKAATPPTKI